EVQEVAEQLRHAAYAVIEPCTAVEIPSDDGDRAPGAQRRVGERPEIRLAIDDERQPLGAPHAVAVAAGNEQAAPARGGGAARGRLGLQYLGTGGHLGRRPARCRVRASARLVPTTGRPRLYSFHVSVRFSRRGREG